MSGATSIHAPCPAHLGSGTRDDPWHVVEVWLAVPETGSAPRALMLRRTPKGGGFWQGVSGRVEPGDATYLDAAFRELAEETGLPRAGVEVIDLDRTMDFVGPVSQRWFRKWGVGFVLPSGTDAGRVVLSDEHDEAVLMTFAEAAAALRFEGQVTELQRFAAQLPDAPPG
ncbi:MAG: NUDIX domain-containing protein [Planctomycetota bacterium]|nr:NUDIX domain-containing protein [Planctomycetota bacterium]